MLDAYDCLLDVMYTLETIASKEDWFWFKIVLAKCLGGLKLVIMLNYH